MKNEKKMKAEITEDAERILSYNHGCMVDLENNIRLLESIKERELPRRAYFYISDDHLDGMLNNLKETELRITTLKGLIEDYRKKENQLYV